MRFPECGEASGWCILPSVGHRKPVEPSCGPQSRVSFGRPPLKAEDDISEGTVQGWPHHWTASNLKHQDGWDERTAVRLLKCAESWDSQVTSMHLSPVFHIFLVLEAQVRLVQPSSQSACAEPLEWDGCCVSRTIVSTLQEQRSGSETALTPPRGCEC